MQNCNGKDYDVMVQGYILRALYAIAILRCINASLIASSEIKYCTRRSASFEPLLKNGEPCEKKFVVTLAVRNGQVSVSLSVDYYIHLYILMTDILHMILYYLQGVPDLMFANLAFVDNSTGPVSHKEQMKRPLRIAVKKHQVGVVYPLKYKAVHKEQ